MIAIESHLTATYHWAANNLWIDSHVGQPLCKYSSPLAMLSPFEKGGLRGDLSNKISPNPSFQRGGLNTYHSTVKIRISRDFFNAIRAF